MKKLLVLSLVILFGFSLNAQKVGVKVGYGMSGYNVNFYTPDGSKMASGMNVGLLAGMDFKVIELRADVTYIQLGSDFDSRDMTDADWPARGALEMEVDMNTTVNYLQVGVSAVKSIGPAYVGFGPYFGSALSSTEETNEEIAGETETTTIDIFDDFETDGTGGLGDLYNKTDYGVNLILGAEFTGVFVEGNIGYGFANFINHDSDYYNKAYYFQDKEGTAMEDDAKQNNMFFGLSVGYTFGF